MNDVTRFAASTETLVTDIQPLVTFSVFAYNQERFIREAIEGAFAQTYQPLEIILSDDCSSDRTLEIMHEMARSYSGPHRVMVRCNDRNVGMLNHLLLVGREANGEFIVVAAGDDISLPSRVTTLLQCFSSTNIVAASSDDIIIDEHGNEVSWDQGRFSVRDKFHRVSKTWLLGATAGYRTSFVRSIPSPDKKIHYEDIFATDLLQLSKHESARIHARLVKYRQHSANLYARRIDLDDSEQLECRARETWQRTREAKTFCHELAMEPSSVFYANGSASLRRIEGEMKYLELLSNWPDNSLTERMQLLFYSSLYGHPLSAIARLFGRQGYRRLQAVRKLLRRS